VVERILGKDEVMGSIPIAGSTADVRQTLVCRSPQLEKRDKLTFVGHFLGEIWQRKNLIDQSRT
jgi:hypothetical protein